MSVYACSDLHGNGKLWDKIKEFLKEDDTLYFLGDAADRGPDGWRIIKEMIADPRVIYLAGNHDIILADRIGRPLNYEIVNLHNFNGGMSTWESAENDPDALYLMNQIYKMPRSITYTNANNKVIYMSHSGSTSNDPYDLVWDRHEFLSDYKPEGIDYIIHGHTPNISMFDKFVEANQFLSKDKKYKLPSAECPIGAFWYSPFRCGIDCLTIRTKRTVLIDLDTLEEYIFNEEESE